MLPLATSCHYHFHLYLFHFVLFKFKIFVAKQHPATHSHPHTHMHTHMNTHTQTHTVHTHMNTHTHEHTHMDTYSTHRHVHTHSLTVLASQREMVLSAEQVQRVLENGRNLTAFTESAWPLSVTTHWPLACMHMETKVSLRWVQKKIHSLIIMPHTVVALFLAPQLAFYHLQMYVKKKLEVN